jgi:hypothetical protein
MKKHFHWDRLVITVNFSKLKKIKMSDTSKQNINKFLQLQRGHYLIFGSKSEISNQILLYSKLLDMVRNKWDINTTPLDTKQIELPKGLSYSTNNSSKLLGDTIKITVINNTMNSKDDIPQWVKENYNCIYITNKNNEKTLVQELYSMTC